MLMVGVSAAIIFGVVVVTCLQGVGIVEIAGINFESLKEFTNSLVKLHMFRGSTLFFVPHLALNRL